MTTKRTGRSSDTLYVVSPQTPTGPDSPVPLGDGTVYEVDTSNVIHTHTHSPHTPYAFLVPLALSLLSLVERPLPTRYREESGCLFGLSQKMSSQRMVVVFG